MMMRRIAILFFLMLSPAVMAQDIFGELSLGATVGKPSFFTFADNSNVKTYDGKYVVGGGADARLILSANISVQAGIWYNKFYYDRYNGGEQGSLDFGTIALPVALRVDFLKYFYTDAGVIGALKIGDSYSINTNGLGVLAGLGVQYNFVSGLFVAAEGRAIAYGLTNNLVKDITPSNYGALTYGLCVKAGFRFLVKEDCGCIDHKQARNFRRY